MHTYKKKLKDWHGKEGIVLIRQDAWNQDEDLLLAETVLRHIREGGTQLAAFEEVAEKLSRTSAACGFRWNSAIRKQYVAAIQLAKKTRKDLKRTQLQTTIIEPSDQESSLTSIASHKELSSAEQLEWMDEIISFLTWQKNKINSDQTLTEKTSKLHLENERLTAELAKLRDAYQEVREDYQVMIHAMQRATHREKLNK